MAWLQYVIQKTNQHLRTKVMSTSSSTLDDYKNGSKNCKHCKIESDIPEEYFARVHRDREVPRKKWPKERVLDEMSSFIAEFSYLTDTQGSNQDRDGKYNHDPDFTENTPHEHKHNRNIFKTKRGKHNKRYEDEREVRKSVEWVDEDTENPNRKRKKGLRLKKKYYTPEEADEIDRSRYRQQEKYKENNIRNHNGTKRNCIKKKTRYRRPVSIKSSRCSCDNCSRRSRSRRDSRGRSKIIHTHRNSIRRKQKSVCPDCYSRPTFRIEKHLTPTRHTSRPRHRSECCCEEIKEPPYCPEHAERKREPKHIPIRHERKKSKCSEDFKKENNCIRKQGKKCIKKPMGKFCETERDLYDRIIVERKLAITDSPTIVTLFPKKYQYKEKRLQVADEAEFLENQELPCKCFQCMKKYESLVNMSPCTNSLFCKPVEICQQPVENDCFIQEPVIICQDPMIHSMPKEGNFSVCPKSLIYLPMPHPNQPCIPKKKGVQFSPFETHESDWSSGVRKLTYEPVPFPCENGDCMSEWNMDSCDEQNGRRYFKSVYFKLNCFNQQIDSAITKYFQSILNSDTCLK